jgi:DNA polymerase-1
MKLYVFDTQNIFYRAFYAPEGLTTSYGMPVQGLHGLVRTIHGIMRDHKPDLIAFALEGGGQSLRKTIEPTYKANRTEPPDELKVQLQVLPELLEALGYPTVKFPGYEADDTIAALAKCATAQGLETVIVSSDKDFCQLINQSVKMFNITKNAMVDENDVLVRYGVTPSQFLDFLSIVGDTADNIKGVKGIGEVGAAKLLAEFGSLDMIYKNIGMIKGANQKKLIASQAEVQLAKKLVSFFDPGLHADLSVWCKYNGPNVEKTRALFRRLEFKELETMILGAQVTSVGGVEIGVRR